MSSAWFDVSEKMIASLLTARNANSKIYNLLRHQSVIINKTATLRPSSTNPQNLPNLPVPSLQQTIDKFLPTVRPHLSDAEFKQTENVAKKLLAEAGPLQEHLISKAKQNENWLRDWWLNAAYLEYRSPVIIFSSPGLVFPFAKFNSEDDKLRYAANVIAATVEFKAQIDNDAVPVEKMGKDPLDMAQYKNVIGTCRIPGLPRDSLEYNRESKHIAVAHNNHFFYLELYDKSNNPHSIDQLVSQLRKIVDQSHVAAEPVGILTTESRDNWARTYQTLIKDSVNLKSVKKIQSALFLLCLDKPVPQNDSINRQTAASHQLQHGGGIEFNSGNRWYDKTVQLIIGADGVNGLTYEHSPSEGGPIAVLSDYIVDFIKTGKGNSIKPSDYQGSPEKLSFSISNEVRHAISVASDNLNKLVRDLHMDCITFDGYGKEFIKSQKLSPDSFIQMAIQLAFYRLHKTPGAHYESAGTRKYVHGRTETIRSCSIESVKFAETMLSNASDEEKAAALRTSINAHKKYTVDALNGFGVDRHLLGLKLAALEKKLQVPEIYQDPGYAKSAHFRLSTSQVPTLCDGFMCYGPLTQNGYGCCYNPRKDDMNFAVSSFWSNTETESTRFKQALVDSLNDMRDVLLRSQKSKL